MRFTCLMENTAPAGLCCEHGLSIHLQYRGGSYLLDGGATGKFTENAAALGVDLAGVDAAILSHGHYDHGDGLGAFFAANDHAPVYLRPDALNPQYFQAGPIQKFIGVNRDLLQTHSTRFRTVEGVFPLADGLWLVPDSVPHEQSLVAETARGLVVFNSCCHAGAGEIVKGLLAQFPGQRVYALVGGFHLMGLTGVSSLGVEPGIVKNLARWLTDELGVAQIYTGHCTGAPAFALLQGERPEQFHALTTGDVLEF